MSFMLHDVVGWNPTIEDILVSARAYSAANQEDKSPSLLLTNSGTSEDHSAIQQNHNGIIFPMFLMKI